MAKNEQPIPEDTLTSLPVPDIEKVSSIPFLQPTNHHLQTHWNLRFFMIAFEMYATLTAVPFHADIAHIAHR